MRRVLDGLRANGMDTHHAEMKTVYEHVYGSGHSRHRALRDLLRLLPRDMVPPSCQALFDHEKEFDNSSKGT